MDKSAWRKAKSPAKALFGRPLRVALASWIVERGEDFFLLEAQDAMQSYGEARGNVSDELRNFVSHKLLEEYREGQRVYFRPTESPLWGAFKEIAFALDLLKTPKRR